MASIASGVAVSAGKFFFLARIERVLVRMTRINFGRVWFFFSSGLSVFVGFVWKGTFVLAGASVSLTRPHEEVRVVTEMASLQERIKVLFGQFVSVICLACPLVVFSNLGSSSLTVCFLKTLREHRSRPPTNLARKLRRRCLPSSMSKLRSPRHLPNRRDLDRT